MQINDYPNGTLFETQGKEWFFKVNNFLYSLTKSNTSLTISLFNDDLTFQPNSCGDIITIASVGSDINQIWTMLKHGQTSPVKMIEYKIIWKRTN